MADLKIKIKGDPSDLSRALKTATSKIKSFGGGLKSVFGGVSMGIFGVMATGLSAIGTAATWAAANFEDTAVSFSVMMGNATKAKNLLGELVAFSTKTPFTPEQVFAATKTLMAFGVSAKDVGSQLKLLGNISAGTGKDLTELARIYGKVFVKGKVQAEELNQLSEAGVPIIKELQKQYGATAEEVFKMGSQGKISFEGMQSAMSAMTAEGGIFFDMMSKKSETFNGKLSTLKGNLTNFLVLLGGIGLAENKTVLDGLNKAVELLNFGLERGDLEGAIEFTSGVGGATTKADIDRLRENQKRQSRMDALDNAAQLKEEARLREGLGQSAAMLNAGNLSGGGTLASLGGDISGGGFSARMTIEQRQLDALVSIKDLAEQMAKSMPQYSQRELEMYASDMKDIFKGN